MAHGIWKVYAMAASQLRRRVSRASGRPALERHPEEERIEAVGSHEWLDKYAKLHDISYDQLMWAARAWLQDGRMMECAVKYGPSHFQYHYRVFWANYEHVTFTRVPLNLKKRFIIYHQG